MEERDGLIDEFSAAHNPVEGVLQDTGNAVRVFGDGEDDRVGRAEGGSEIRHEWGYGFPVEVGIVVWQVTDAVEWHDVDRRRCQSGGGPKEGGVGRRGAEATGDGEEFHGCWMARAESADHGNESVDEGIPVMSPSTGIRKMYERATPSGGDDGRLDVSLNGTKQRNIE